MKVENLSFVSVQGKKFFRYMSESEYLAIINRRAGQRLRGDRPGTAYFTDDAIDSARGAQNRLSLGTTPEVRVEFIVKNNPTTIFRPNVKPDGINRGGGSEFFSSNEVLVEVLGKIDLR
jgi:hypothetical protein